VHRGKGVLGEPSQSPMRPRVPQEPKKLGLRSLKWKRKNRVSRCRREILRGLDTAIGTVVKQEGRGVCGQEGTSHYRGEGEREVPFLVLAANRRNKRQKVCRPRDSAWHKNEERLGKKCRGA
jgi:hypothetical protein